MKSPTIEIEAISGCVVEQDPLRIVLTDSEATWIERPVSLYKQLLEAGCKMDNHESDLYVESTEVAHRIVKGSGHSFRPFVNALDKSMWLDVPFAFDPWWDKRLARAGVY